MKTIAYIGAALFIVFGALFVLAAFSSGSSAGVGGSIIIGLILLAVGFGIIFFVSRQSAKAAAASNVTLKIDLPGDVNMESIKCKSCGGVITSENITMVNGAPVVTCPYCHTVYQLTEEPKW